MAYRPTRKHRTLKAKLEEKQARSRVSGKKARRMKKWLEAYEARNRDADGPASSPSGDNA
ncbi:MAG: hypothetical protein AAF928_19585 [Myxococcota bacterium]